jgi:hypothetical protein
MIQKFRVFFIGCKNNLFKATLIHTKKVLVVFYFVCFHKTACRFPIKMKTTSISFYAQIIHIILWGNDNGLLDWTCLQKRVGQSGFLILGHHFISKAEKEPSFSFMQSVFTDS